MQGFTEAPSVSVISLYLESRAQKSDGTGTMASFSDPAQKVCLSGTHRTLDEAEISTSPLMSPFWHDGWVRGGRKVHERVATTDLQAERERDCHE